MLRQKQLFALTCVLVYPVYLLVQKFKGYRKECIENMQINGQVIYIEKILNDTYFLKNKEIYLSDIENKQPYLYIRSEQQRSITLRRRSEGQEASFLKQRSEGNTEGNYIVNVPSFLEDRIEDIRRIVEKYKPSGRKYIINIYEYE